MKQIQASVVQTLDSAIYWINHYPVEKCWGKPIAISSGEGFIRCRDSVIHLLNNWGQIIMSACNNEHEAGQLAMFSSSPCEIVILANFYTKKYNHSLPSLPSLPL